MIRQRPSLIRRATSAGAALSVACAIGVAASVPASAAPPASGHVYLISNEPAGNALVVFDRNADGTLEAPTSIPTGGTGTGAGIGSQGAVAVSDNGEWVLAVNPGSDEISLFGVRRGEVELLETTSSGGDLPISVTVHGQTAYVLNAGANNNVTGFRLNSFGLRSVPGSTQALSHADAGAAQVGFTPDGDTLVVTQKATNTIDTFRVRHGVADPATPNASTGVTPFGFSFTDNRLLVSNANGGAANGSSMSSYKVRGDGSLRALDGPDATNQTAACWVAVSRNGKFAYTTNTGSASVTGYRVSARGALELLDADGVTANVGTSPTDFDFSRDGRMLYTLNSSADSISVHRFTNDGGLVPVTTVAGLGANALGLTSD